VGIIVPYIPGWRLYGGLTEINADMLQAIEEPIEQPVFTTKSLRPELSRWM
jgi:hypothetical protein